MANRTLVLPIKSGEKTCASSPGEFCHWLRTRKFGQIYVCGLFNETLEGEEWLERCPACLSAEVTPGTSKG